jgi:hypothetical protein
MTNYIGIDYGRGMSNIDNETGIRYGVISIHAVGEYLYDSQEFDYWLGCSSCGTDFDATCEDWRYCPYCGKKQYDDSWYGGEPIGWKIDDEEYLVVDCLDSDAMVIRSPYYTHAQFCSPCVPGACNLNSPCEDGPKAYCFGSDWFDEYNPCPYPVYRVSDDALVYTPAIEE